MLLRALRRDGRNAVWNREDKMEDGVLEIIRLSLKSKMLWRHSKSWQSRASHDGSQTKLTTIFCPRPTWATAHASYCDTRLSTGALTTPFNILRCRRQVFDLEFLIAIEPYR